MSLPYEDEDDLRGHLETFGELFDTGHAEQLRAEWFDDHQEVVVGDHVVLDRVRRIRCLVSDKELHRLVRGSPVRRAADGAQYSVKEFEPDGVGLTFITLSE